MRIAFKEWAIVVDALERGEQILILRKGGISEGRAGFQVDHPRFLLFPTLYHQQRESVLPASQLRYDVIAPGLPSPDIVRISSFAEVVSWRSVESLQEALNLRSQHIWLDDVIKSRFDWGRSKNIFALAVRVYRMGNSVEMPMLTEYGGCKSWVELANDVELGGAVPVMGDAEFERRLKAFETAVSCGAGLSAEGAKP